MENTSLCSICLLELDKKDIIFTPCIHGFHSDCIKQWITHKKNKDIIPCPMCKYDISILKNTFQLTSEDELSEMMQELLTLEWATHEQNIRTTALPTIRRTNNSVNTTVINGRIAETASFPIGRRSTGSANNTAVKGRTGSIRRPHRNCIRKAFPNNGKGKRRYNQHKNQPGDVGLIS